MSTIAKAKAGLNHTVARWEAHHKLINTRIAPTVGAALGLAALGYDLYQANSIENKKRVLIRDGLVLGGIALTSLLALAISMSGSKDGKRFWALSVEKSKEKARNAFNGSDTGFKTFMGRWADWLEKYIFRKKDGPKGFHAHGGIFGRSPIERVQGLFRSSVHDHGTKGALVMTLMSALPIYLGGVGFGTMADAINREDWRKNWKLKFKEATFQFLGNITMCTLGILLLSKVARGVSNQLWKNTAFKERTIQATKKQLNKLTQVTNLTDKRLVPAGLSQIVESAFVEGKDDIAGYLKKKLNELFRRDIENTSSFMPIIREESRRLATLPEASLKEAVETFLKQNASPEALKKQTQLVEMVLKNLDTNPTKIQNTLTQRLTAALRDNVEATSSKSQELGQKVSELFNTSHPDKSKIHVALQEYVAQQMKTDITAVTQDTEQLTLVAKNRLDSQSDVVGVVAGFLTGVFGGAGVSNGVNQLLTNHFNFPEGHPVNGLFKGHHHDLKKPNEANKPDNGWLAGKLGGPRGLYWFDWLLHGDDIPAALYMAGVEIVEASIQVLYGISALVTGTTGTDYTQNPQKSLPKYSTFDNIQHRQPNALSLQSKPAWFTNPSQTNFSSP